MLHLFIFGLLKDFELKVELLSQHKIESKVIVAPETKDSISANYCCYWFVKHLVTVATLKATH
jgi:hypothetical protein